MKKLIAAVLALFLVTAVAVSCKEDKTPENPTKTTAQTETTSLSTVTSRVTSESTPTTQTETTPEVTTVSTVLTTEKPPEPVIDYGQFGETLPDVFAAEGEVIKNDTQYISHDISITFTDVVETRFKRTIRYFVYDIYIRDIENLYTSNTTSSGKNYDYVENLALELPGVSELPVFTINGDQWHYSSTNLSKMFKVTNGEEVHRSNIGDLVEGMCVLYYDGTMEVVYPNDDNIDEIIAKKPYQTWCFGPSLINDEGRAFTYDELAAVVGETRKSFRSGRTRTAIGYYEPGHYCMIYIYEDTAINGLSLPQLAEIAETLGCKVAYNLDGGKSSKVKFNGSYTGAPDRSVSDLICIGEVSGTEITGTTGNVAPGSPFITE